MQTPTSTSSHYAAVVALANISAVTDESAGDRSHNPSRRSTATRDNAPPHLTRHWCWQFVLHFAVKSEWVPGQDADTGAPTPELEKLEVATEGFVRGGAKNDRKGEAPLQEQGPVRGRVAPATDIALPAHHGGPAHGGTARRRRVKAGQGTKRSI